MEEECPTDTVCFHAQQCVEKYLKALLVLLSVDFPRTHDIRRLLMFLPQDLAAALGPADQERLTDYAVTTRYPGDYEPIPLKEARRAVQLARAVRRAVRKLLPKEVARRGRRSAGH
jgi:HEPN domain-containing protein